MSRDTGPWRGRGYVLGWGEQSIDDMQDGNRAGVARSMGSSCIGNLGLTLQLRIGAVSEKIPKQELEAIG